MILFINCYITNKRSNPRAHARHYYPNNDRLDIFKYMLHSLSVIDRWSKVVIYCQLDTEYVSREKELINCINELFENVSFYPYRVMRQLDWKHALQEVLDYPDNLVWFLSNDDHIFIDNSLDRVHEAIDLLNAEEGRASLYFSHWPESMRYFAGRGAERCGSFVVTERSVTDGIQLVNKKLLYDWWFGSDYGNCEMRRSDDIMIITPGHQACSPYNFKCFAPLKEMVAHFDTYGHVGISGSVCPPHMIPPGFFDGNIRIAYCPEKRLNGWVHLDPTAKNYYATDREGTDYRWTLDQIPLFWKDKILETHRLNCPSDDDLKEGYRESVLNMLKVKPRIGDWVAESDAEVPVEWMKHL